MDRRRFEAYLQLWMSSTRLNPTTGKRLYERFNGHQPHCLPLSPSAGARLHDGKRCIWRKGFWRLPVAQCNRSNAVICELLDNLVRSRRRCSLSHELLYFPKTPPETYRICRSQRFGGRGYTTPMERHRYGPVCSDLALLSWPSSQYAANRWKEGARERTAPSTFNRPIYRKTHLGLHHDHSHRTPRVARPMYAPSIYSSVFEKTSIHQPHSMTMKKTQCTGTARPVQRPRATKQ